MNRAYYGYGCATWNLGTVAAGSYSLLVDAYGSPGTYSLKLEESQTFAAGSSFPISISPDTINGASVPGAGRFQDGGAQDIYTFSVPAGGLMLNLNVAGCQNSPNWEWRILNSSGNQAYYGYGCATWNLGAVAAGNYSLVLDAYGSPGTYNLRLEVPQTFAAGSTFPISIAPDTVNGASAPGAGRLETGASQDRYTFTVPTGGLTLNLNVAGCQNSPNWEWRILDASGNQTNYAYGCATWNLGTIAAGNHTLVFDAYGSPGTYSLTLG